VGELLDIVVGLLGAGTMGRGIAQVAAVAGDCVLATNTSSLPPTALAAPAQHPERNVRLHFFNLSVWVGFGQDLRFAPSIAPRAVVEAGWLGGKAVRGIYHHTGHQPAVSAEPRKAPLEVVQHGSTDLRAPANRSRVAVLDGEGDSGTVELPSGALRVRRTGTTATTCPSGTVPPSGSVPRGACDAATGETVAMIRTGGPDPAAVHEYARDVGGPALRALTFTQRAAILRSLARRTLTVSTA
jgi:hypothetical protein